MKKAHYGTIKQSVDVAGIEDNASLEFPTTTYLVLQFAPGLQPETVRWITARICARRELGGAELLLRRQPGSTPAEGYTIHVSATPSKLRRVAEELDLRKPHQQEPLSSSERRFIVQHELLQGIRAQTNESHVPGYPEASLYHGQSIVEVLHQRGILESLYPLHNKEQLRMLRRLWYCTLLKTQPIEEIRGYFGDAVALYFCFLGFYTMALLFPTVLGLLQLWFADVDSAMPAVCSILGTFWVILFLVLWKRRSNELAHSWGTIKMTGLDEPRPSFRGVMGVDPVTDRIQPQYPRWRAFIKMYLVSWPIALGCGGVAFYVMLASFWAEQYIVSWGTLQEDGSHGPMSMDVMVLSLIPSVVYTALVWLMNLYYRRLATWLTEWENHRTQSQFDRHRVLKLVAFEFVNNFMALFYIAFVYQDMEMLRYQIAIMLILLQALNHFQEVFIPFWLLKYARKISRSMRQEPKVKKDSEQRRSSDEEQDEEDMRVALVSSAVRRRTRRQSSLTSLLIQEGELQRLNMKDVPELDPDDPRVIRAMEEMEQDQYESTYDDYLELFIQFGYVILFSPVYPAAALFAVLNNILEMRTDAFKLCRVTQRPLPKRVKDIGAWQRAFEALGIVSVATNCALLFLMPGVRARLAPDSTDLQWALTICGLEHALFTLGLLLYLAVPSQPEHVRVALARLHYQSQRILKHAS